MAVMAHNMRQQHQITYKYVNYCMWEGKQYGGMEVSWYRWGLWVWEWSEVGKIIK